MRPETILILGGTLEAAQLAARLVADMPGARIVTSLAGRTREPAPVAGELRTGGFGGPEGLADWIRENAVSTLVDATHPFAMRISAHAREAARRTGVRYLRLSRPAWERQPGDSWIEVATLESAARAIPAGATVLLALGRQYLSAFASRPDCRFVLRMVDPPQEPLPFPAEILLGRPSSDPKTEAALFRKLDLTCLVCRNSGGDGAVAKIVAARSLRLPVVMVTRPDSAGSGLASVDDVMRELGKSVLPMKRLPDA